MRQDFATGVASGGSVALGVTAELFPHPEVYAEYPTPENAPHDEYHYHNAATCPDCGQGMVRQGTCFQCPVCGYSSCGV